jgi:hypothetical protein
MKKNVTEDQELYKERRQRLLEVEEQSMIDNSVKRSPGHSYPTVAPGRKSLIDMTASEDDPDDPRENPVERTVFRYSETHHGNRSSNHKQCYDSSKRMPSECELSFKKNRALRRWKKLRQYVLSGEALLTLRTVKDEDGNTQSLSAQYSSWVVNDHVFTLNQCLMAIVAWIAIAVIAFRTVFGGHNWSVIDCIYFSVVTFTTGWYLKQVGRVFQQTRSHTFATFFTQLVMEIWSRRHRHPRSSSCFMLRQELFGYQLLSVSLVPTL